MTVPLNIRVMNKFRPYHRALQVFNRSQFSGSCSHVFPNICRALCSAIFLSMVLLLAILDIWYCFDQSVTFDVRAVSTAICAIQAFLTNVSLAMNSGRVSETTARLQEIVIKRELHLFSLKNSETYSIFGINKDCGIQLISCTPLDYT